MFCFLVKFQFLPCSLEFTLTTWQLRLVLRPLVPLEHRNLVRLKLTQLTVMRYMMDSLPVQFQRGLRAPEAAFRTGEQGHIFVMLLNQGVCL